MVTIIMTTDALTYRFINTTTFVMGNRKNAGKTTFLNWALNQIRKVESPAFATIGIDGENNDMIDGRNKPQIKTIKGDAIVTSTNMLAKSNGLFKIEKAFPIYTQLGQIVIAKTVRDGNIELVGPEHNEQLTQVVDHLMHELGYKSIIIDGAASRITPVNSIPDSGFYYLVNIDHRNLKKTIEQMQLLSLCSKFETLDVETNHFKIDGALTATKLNNITNEYSTLLINDLTSVFINYTQLTKLLQQVDIKVKNKLNLKGFVIVLKDIEQTEFDRLITNKNIDSEIIYNPYVH
ncbi:MAG: hypothetical protein MI866_06680 [Bacteroidales bacterium]|nr:hypothetical protein [Bacteroidales bacterium]